MNILQVCAGDFFSTYGGGQVYVKNLVDGIIQQGIEVTVLSFVGKIDRESFQKKKYKGKDLYELGDVDLNSLKSVVSEIKPDVIHAHSHKGWMCVIGHEMGIPVVVTAHHGGIVCPGGALLDYKGEICREKTDFKRCLKCVLRGIRTGQYWYPFMRYLPEYRYIQFGKYLSSRRFILVISPIGSAALGMEEKKNEWNKVIESASIVIAPCRELGEAMVRNGLDESKLKIVTHGIPLPKSPVPRKGKSRCNEVSSTSFSNGLAAIDFFYVGRICYVKGIHVLVKAFMGVKNPDVRLHLIGGAGNKGERRYERRMRCMSRKDNRIIWHGKVRPEEVFEMTKDFDIALSPSIFLEAFGLNIAEAMALGKPVLGVYNGGAEMQIKEGINGWLVQPNDVESLRDKIEWIADARPTMDMNEIAGTVKGIEEHVGELREIYENLANVGDK